MSADDLVGGVALDALSAAIPRQYMAGGIQHEDRIVADALDEAPVAFVAVGEEACRDGGRLQRHVGTRAVETNIPGQQRPGPSGADA